MSYIRWFADALPEEVALVGGKGGNLARLVRAGFPVPPGFCLTTEAQRAALATLGPEADAARRRAVDLPAAVASELAAAFAQLGGPVAVRSSATGEDGFGASFAGQHETALNVNDPTALRAAVRRCWASLWNDAATLYRQTKQIADDGLAMAVVVQRLAPATVSGVAFTIDPVRQDPSRIVIEACYGLGEALVNGQITPDHFVLTREDSAIVERQIGDKALRIVSDERGGTVRETLPPEQASAPCLTDAQVRALAALAVRVEAHCGQPMDIEWAIASDEHRHPGGTRSNESGDSGFGGFVLLQARPVTTGRGAAPMAGLNTLLSPQSSALSPRKRGRFDWLRRLLGGEER